MQSKSAELDRLRREAAEEKNQDKLTELVAAIHRLLAELDSTEQKIQSLTDAEQ